MIITGKHDGKVKQKEWEDPSNPEKPGDERDSEQLLRQYDEAKRENNNLSENQKVNKKTN